MTANGREAHAHLLAYAPLERHGACWYYVWQAYAAAGAQTSMGSSATAYEGWTLSQGKHYDLNPPEGAAVWLGRRYDGEMSGDVFIAGPADGEHAATDQPTYGRTGLTTLRARMELCGREYLGWTDHVLDVPIDLGSTPTTDGDEMPVSYIRIHGKGGERKGGNYAVIARPGDKPRAVFVGEGGADGLLTIMDEAAIERLQTLIDHLY